MPGNLLSENVGEIVSMVETGIIGMLGGTVNYFYSAEKGKKAIGFGSFAVNAGLAFFVAFEMGELLPASDYRHGIAGLSGYCCYPIIGLLEAWIINAVKRFTNPSKELD